MINGKDIEFQGPLLRQHRIACGRSPSHSECLHVLSNTQRKGSCRQIWPVLWVPAGNKVGGLEAEPGEPGSLQDRAIPYAFFLVPCGFPAPPPLKSLPSTHKDRQTDTRHSESVAERLNGEDETVVSERQRTPAQTAQWNSPGSWKSVSYSSCPKSTHICPLRISRLGIRAKKP